MGQATGSVVRPPLPELSTGIYSSDKGAPPSRLGVSKSAVGSRQATTGQVGLENHLAITTSAGHLQPAAGIALAVARPRHSLRRKSAHRIEDIHYGPDAGPSWSACTCGESFDAESPDALAALWIAHKKDGLT